MGGEQALAQPSALGRRGRRRSGGRALRPDLDFFNPSVLTEEPGRSATVYAESIEPILRAGQAVIWDDAHTIDEDLELRLAPGHTPGHGIVTLESGDDRAVFVGDLLHSPAQVLAPDLSSCFCHEPAAAARTRRKVLQWAAGHTTLVIPAHFGGARAVEIERNGPGFAVRRWAGFSDDLPPTDASGGRSTSERNTASADLRQ